jgi:hypothetical protein
MAGECVQGRNCVTAALWALGWTVVSHMVVVKHPALINLLCHVA